MTSELSFDKFLLFGDSITEYSFNPQPRPSLEDSEFAFGGALQNAYARKLDILQRGFAGYNSEQARILLPKILSIETPKHDIPIMTIFFGTNDAALGGPQKVEIDRYHDNLVFLVESALSHKIKPILIGPGFHNAEVWNPTRPEDVAKGIVRTTENNKLYSDTAEKVAKKFGIPYVSMFEQFDKYNKATGGYEDLLTDGIHYSGKAYKLLFNELLKQIKINYPELYPENIKKKLPEWKELSNEKLKEI